MTENHKFSNQTLYLPTQNQYYVPAYLRLLLKKITKINISDAQAEMSATLILTLYTKHLPLELLQQIQNKIDITINNQINLRLDSSNSRITTKTFENTCTYIYRSIFALQLNCDVMITPFQNLDLSLSISLRSLELKLKQNKNTVKFNLMDNIWNASQKFSYQTSQSFGNYGIIISSFKAQYTHDLKKHQKKQITKTFPIHRLNTTNMTQTSQNLKMKKISKKSWQHAKFQFKMYRFPLTDLITIFVPLLLLSLINLTIFFQDNTLSGRVSSIATLMVAYSAFLPTVRTRIPPSPNFTFIDFFVYSLLSSSVLCLLRSYLDRNIQPYTYNWQSDIIFIICLIIVCLSIISIILLLIIHKLIWEPKYKLNTGNLSDDVQQFDRNKWSNSQCDDYFDKMDGIQVMGGSNKKVLRESQKIQEQLYEI